ncbi:MAG: hypothetical protein IT350_08830 [Deltaproteobacteria bacterium]|nr:hypothetical protein [Deltaproteobacteria bacterium]
MRTGNRRRVFAIALCIIVFRAVSAWASPCVMSEPPEALGDLFTECENEYEDFRTEPFDTNVSNDTSTKIVRDDFVIDQMQVMTIGLDYSQDWNETEPNRQAKYYREFCTSRVRYRAIVRTGGGGSMTEGWTYGFLATERPVDEEGRKIDCEVDFLNGLGRPGVLFLPGLENVATPSMAAKYAAMFSADTPDTGVNAAKGKVMLLMIAPPGHKAISEKQIDEDADPNDDCEEDFCTVFMGPGDTDYDGIWHTSLGLLGNAAPPEYEDYDISAAIGKSLLGGFIGENNPKPDRHILWWYAESAMKGISLFQHFFADETNPWTNGELFVGGFSMGGIASMISNEADPGSRVTGTFTIASHVGLEDNFRVPGDFLALRLLTSDGAWSPPVHQAPFVSWDCDRFDSQSYLETLGDVYPQIAIDRMDASCRVARYFSPLLYDPTFAERPVLLAQGAQDEPFSVRGMERTWMYLADYLGTDLAKMHLAPDLDHKYFMGMAGAADANLRDYYSMNLTPSKDLDADAYPDFGEATSTFETFLNGDWINPSGVFQNLDMDAPFETLALNRVLGTVRHFILSNASFLLGTAPDPPELVSLPPAPVSPTTLEPGVLVTRSVHRVPGIGQEPDYDVAQYEMISCFRPTTVGEEAEIFFHASADRFWHVLPGCEDESTNDYDRSSLGNASYLIDQQDNYLYNTTFAERDPGTALALYVDKCRAATGDSDVSRFHDGFLGVDVLDVYPFYPVPEDHECRVFSVAFGDPISATPNFSELRSPRQFTAWAELREYDNGSYLAGTTTPVTMVGTNVVPPTDGPPPYEQHVRPDAGPLELLLRALLEFLFPDRWVRLASFEFPVTTSCASLELDEWPDPVDEEVFLDLTGYDVTVPASTSLETGPQGLMIVTDCDFTIESGASLGIDPDDDTNSDITIVARNITVGGSISNDSDVSGSIHLAAFNSIEVESGAEISVTNAGRTDPYGAGTIRLQSQGSLVIDGQLAANETLHGGVISVFGEDVTINTDASFEADADPMEEDSGGGLIAIRAKDDLDVNHENPDHPTFSAQGEADGTIRMTACTADTDEGDYVPAAVVDDGECTDETPLDLSEVEWCDGYEGTDLCCVDGDPCDLGDDRICQCGDTCSWEAGDCEKIDFVFNIYDAESELPVEGATCTLVNNSTGQPLSPSIETESDAAGNCDFSVGEGLEVSVRVMKTGYRPLYVFNMMPPGTMRMFLASDSLVDDIADSLNVTQETGTGILFGAVYWSAPSEWEGVGCAVISNDAGATQTFYQNEYGAFTDVRTSTWTELYSAYLTFNVDAGGPYTVTATAGEEEEGAYVPKVFETAITMAPVVFGDEYETNPTPAECE